MPDHESAEYVSKVTLAARLDCGTSTVDDYVKQGLLPLPRRIGTLLRWKWSEVVEMIDDTYEVKQPGLPPDAPFDPILVASHGKRT